MRQTTGMHPAQNSHRNWTRSTERARRYLKNREATDPMKLGASKPPNTTIASTAYSVAVQATYVGFATPGATVGSDVEAPADARTIETIVNQENQRQR
jgi:hypothetical protein